MDWSYNFNNHLAGVLLISDFDIKKFLNNSSNCNNDNEDL